MPGPPPQGMPHFGKVPLIGQQQQREPSEREQREQAKAQVQAVIGQLGLGIYTQLAAAHIGTRDKHQEVSPDHLRKIAKDAHDAARCYFEGIGVIQRAEEKPAS